MNRAPTRLVKHPSDCSENELEEFARLVRMGGEVDDRVLDGQIRAAHLLAFAYYSTKCVAVAAIKNPLVGYRTRVSKGSGFDLNSGRWPFELGYIFVHPHSRGEGLSSVLSEMLLSNVSGVGIFATTRSNNGAMNILLPRLGFAATGAEYSSSRGGDRLRLHVRSVSGER